MANIFSKSMHLFNVVNPRKRLDLNMIKLFFSMILIIEGIISLLYSLFLIEILIIFEL